MKDFTQTNESEAIELLNKEVFNLKEELRWCNAEIPALKKCIRDLRLYKDIHIRSRCSDRIKSNFIPFD